VLKLEVFSLVSINVSIKEKKVKVFMNTKNKIGICLGNGEERKGEWKGVVYALHIWQKSYPSS